MAAPELTADVPVGGSTGPSHEHRAGIEEAARWLAALPRPIERSPLVLLRETFGLTGEDALAALREHSRIVDKIGQAAAWLADTPMRERPKPIVPALRSRFDLTTQQACSACRRAADLQARGPT